MRVDQMHANNAPSHPELLDWLARDLVAHGYDLKRLICGLVSSNAYAPHEPLERQGSAAELFAVAAVRPLTPLQWGVSHRIASDPTALKSGPPQAVAGDAGGARDWQMQRLEDKCEKAFANVIGLPRDGMQIGITESMRSATRRRSWN